MDYVGIEMAGRPSAYLPEFAEVISDIMYNTPLQGTPAHLCRALKVSRQTLWRWRKEIPEFKEAYDVGHPMVEAAYIDAMLSDPKRTAPCMAVLNNLFEWRKEGNSGETKISIENMNVLNATPPKDLLERARELIGQISGNKVTDGTSGGASSTGVPEEV